MTVFARGSTIRRDAGLYGYERALTRVGLSPIAGVDEAGRGACAGPLVAAAVVLDGPVDGLADSKLLSAVRRDACYELILDQARAVAVVAISPDECDRRGIQSANIEALRRALARLDVRPGYVLTDGFPVDGLGVPGLAMWKGDRVSASIAAASVVAKVTRDRQMTALAAIHPTYDFDMHKGYVTMGHQAALLKSGPCPAHRLNYANVRAAMEARNEC